jgi:hypothetical protein
MRDIRRRTRRFQCRRPLQLSRAVFRGNRGKVIDNGWPTQPVGVDSQGGQKERRAR